MSRTYRRLKGDNTRRLKSSRDVWWVTYKHPDVPYEQGKVLYMIRWHRDAYRPMTTPGWFTRDTCHAPMRAETRNLMAKLKLVIDLEDAPIFPDKVRRPWFW